MVDDAALYGDSFADVYDEWYGDMFDTEGAVRTLLELAGSGPICELGVGTGRLAIPLAEHGVEVIGIDASAAMLERLAAKAPPASLTAVLGDMASVADVLAGNAGRNADQPPRFRLIICAFNTFLNLASEEAQLRCMGQVASLLTVDGVFVVESVVPAEPDEIVTESVDESSVGHGVTVRTSTDVDSQIIHGEHLEPTSLGTRRRPWTARYLRPEQFDELASRVGLSPIERWSSWQREPFSDDSLTHITVYAPA
jgi:SAM-dependent methyltransferase